MHKKKDMADFSDMSSSGSIIIFSSSSSRIHPPDIIIPDSSVFEVSCNLPLEAYSRERRSTASAVRSGLPNPVNLK